MEVTVQRLWTLFLAIFMTCVLIFTLLEPIKQGIPVNKVTHECVAPGMITFSESRDIQYGQGFCQEYYAVEFKASLDRTISNVAGVMLLISGLMLAPLTIVLIWRLSARRIIKRPNNATVKK
jgi:hypothetical protein